MTLLFRAALTVCVLAGSLAAQTPALPLSAPPSPADAPSPEVLALRLSKTTPLGKKPDWSGLDAYQGVFTRAEFESAWREIYSTESGLPAPLKILADTVEVPTGQPLTPVKHIAFRPEGAPRPPQPARYWRAVEELPPQAGRPVLSDLKIALDPGHIGGAWARMEERFLSFQPGEAIQEGDLALITARVLQERLAALGAEVVLVREQPEPVTLQRPGDLMAEAAEILKEMGILNPAQSYEGLAGDAKSQTLQWQAEKLFYRVSEIHARAGRVNERIKPDLVLCLHLNAESWGAAEAPQFSPQNHLHILVNGCYSAVELEQADVRFEMLRRIFQRAHEQELPLAAAVADGMAFATGLPAYVYTTPNARRAAGNAHVYARNLLANRLYECPVVYLEPYVMNHEETYRRLIHGHWLGRTLIGGRLQTSALEDYAHGVVHGLTAYYQKHRRP
ncbi:MAG TPA: hypothetical protein DIT64_02220 [Verrucomicrobiales bacterium]|nr:hypothetical protein [Verrucomicrobiales bacterium]